MWKNFFFTHKKSLLILGVLFCGIFLGIFFRSELKYWYKQYFGTFEVSGANFDFDKQNIPYNTKSIDFYFSQDIDPESIKVDSIRIFPDVPSQVLVTSSNRISLQLQKKLEMGKDYSLLISADISAKSGKKLPHSGEYILKAVAGASVTKVLPETQLENVGKNMSVFFSVPMRPLTSPSEAEAGECPVLITPKIEAKCVWTTPSVLEVIPAKSWNFSTQYSYEISGKTHMLYPLEKTYTGTFSTPKLQGEVAETFMPKQNVILTFNADVDKNDLIKHLSFSGVGEVEIKSYQNSKNMFEIIPKFQSFQYDSDYELTLSGGLLPLHGNIPLEKTFAFSLHSEPFLASTQIYKNKFSSTGAILESEMVDIGTGSTQYAYFPLKNTFLNLSFHEEVSLDKDLFSFTDTKGNAQDFSLSYVKEENEKNEIQENKKMLRFELKKPLQANTSYELRILQSANKNLKKDIVLSYKTAPELELSEVKFLDYSRSCLYFNNSLGMSYGEWKKDVKNNISFSPSGVIKGWYDGQYLDWEAQQVVDKMPDESQKNNYLLSQGICPQYQGKHGYVLETRLLPETQYQGEIKNIEDQYGNILKTPKKYGFATQKLKDSDVYLYSNFSQYVNVFPLHADMNIDIQAMNTDRVDTEVCEMSFDTYKNYITKKSSDPNIQPECLQKNQKTLSTKKLYWKLTHNVFNLEKDILGKKTNAKVILFDAFSTQQKVKNDKNLSYVFLRNDMSLFVEQANNYSLLFAQDIQSKEFISGLQLDFYDANGQKVTIPYAYESAKKTYKLSGDISSVAFISAGNEKYNSFITQENVFSNYDFKYISGQESVTKDYLYTYTDRPIYRPGDQVFLKGILRTFTPTGYKKSSLQKGIVRILSQEGRLFRSIDITLDSNGNFSTSFIIPKDASLGNFKIQFQSLTQAQTSLNDGGMFFGEYIYTYGNFYIEEYKKPTFKIDVSGEKNDYQMGDEISLQLQPKYYFGGKITQAQGHSSVLSQNYMFDAKTYSDYQFGEGNKYFDCVYWGMCDFGDSLSQVQSFEVSEKGTYDYTFSYDAKDKNTAEKIYSLNFTIQDPQTQKSVTKTVSQVLHTTDGYVGIKTPYFSSLSSGMDIQGIVLDWNAQPLVDKKVTTKIFSRDYFSTKKLGVDGVYYSDYSSKDTLVDEFSSRSDAQGMFQKNLKVKKSGEYVIVSSYTGENNQTFSSTQTVYVSGESVMNWRNDNNTLTDLVPQKGVYRAGETAKMVLKTPTNSGKVIVLIEKDDAILDYFVQDIQSYGDTLSYKISPEHYPNLYVKAFFLGTQEKNPLPIFKRALTNLKVITEDKKLSVTVTSPKKHYVPGEKVEFDIKVLDSDGKPVPQANGSFSLVDESVLALKGNPQKNPYAFFYEMKRYLGAISWSNLKFLVEKLEIKDISGGEKGGAGDTAKGGVSKKSRGDFRDTAYYEANFTTSASGTAKIMVPKLPDNLTTWVAEALVNTSNDNKIGVGNTSIETSKPVMLEDNLPRFFLSGDKVLLHPVVHNRTGKNGSFGITLKTTLTNRHEQTMDLLIAQNDQNSADFEITPNMLSQNAYMKVEMWTYLKTNPELQDRIVKYIPIFAPKTSLTHALSAKAGQTPSQERVTLGAGDSGTLEIRYGTTLFSYLFGGVQSEQEVQETFFLHEKNTQILPFIMTKRLYQAYGKEYDLSTKMVHQYRDETRGLEKISLQDYFKNYLSEIQAYQNTDGGMVYDAKRLQKISDFTLSVETLGILQKLKNLGFEIDKKMYEGIQNYVKKEFYNQKLCHTPYANTCLDMNQKLFAIEVLSSILSGDEAYKMYLSFQESDFKNVSEGKRAYTLLKLLEKNTFGENLKAQVQGDFEKRVEKILSNQAVINSRGAFISSDEHSRIQNTAHMIEMLVYLNKKENQEMLTKLGEFLSYLKSGNDFGNMQETSSVYEAIGKYIMLQKDSLADTTIRITLNGKTIEEKKITQNNIFETFTKKISFSDMKRENLFTFQSSQGNVYYELALQSQVDIADQKEKDEGFTIQKQYFSYEEYKKIEKLKQQEYEKYLSGEIQYDDLEYKKEVPSYLTPVKKAKVGELIYVHHTLITSETRDFVGVSGYFPAGSEGVNTQLATEDSTIHTSSSDIEFEHQEIRDHYFYGYVDELDIGVHHFGYVIRTTHEGTFQIPPTQVQEVPHKEVYGLSSGDILEFYK